MDPTDAHVISLDRASIRRRPGMFVGDTGAFGLHHLGSFALDFVLTSAVQPPGRIDLTLDAVGALVISADCVPLEPGAIASWLALGERRAPAEPPEPLWWWQLLAASALSEAFTFSWRTESGGGSWKGRRGEPSAATEVLPGGARALELRIEADPGIFGATRFDFDHLTGRLRELAVHAPGTRVSLKDLRTGRESAAVFPRGFANLVTELSGLRTFFPEPVEVDGLWGEVRIRAALQCTHASHAGTLILSFANTVRTRGGGKHERGLLRAIEAAGQEGLWPRLEGLVAIVAVDAPRALVFEGPTKDVLGTQGLEEAVRDLVLPALDAAIRATG